MTNKTDFYCADHCCDCFEDDGNHLETENTELREAVSHFFSCRTCAEDSVFSCFDGLTYARKFNLIAETEKAG